MTQQLTLASSREIKRIWKVALAYLFEKAGEEAIRRHMDTPLSTRKPRKLNTVYKHFLQSLRNRQAMFSTIGDIDRMSALLHRFNPKKVNIHYGQDAEALCRDLGIRLEVTINPTNKRSYWNHFAKGTLDGALFFSRFNNVDDFYNFVDDFYAKETTRPALPLVLSQEIHGLGFALACDFLKEIGFDQYAKPDVHIIGLFTELGLTTSAEIDVYRGVCEFAKVVGETPFAVDKAFWLIGSGNLHFDNTRFKTSRNEFLIRAKSV